MVIFLRPHLTPGHPNASRSIGCESRGLIGRQLGFGIGTGAFVGGVIR